MQFQGRGVLLDIEGTTSSISFVYDQMFPFVLRELDDFLAAHFAEPEVQSAAEQIAQDVGHESLADWQADRDGAEPQALIAAEVRRLMSEDVKATGLKQLQGLIWKAGFESGELRAHVFDDVPPALRSWNEAGFDLRIYSSGSVQAQKLFFGHTEQGNLLPLFQGHYDTKTGPKKESASYRLIAEQFQLDSAQILFLSDNVDELNAAAEAGCQVALCVRPGNPEPPAHSHSTIESFAELDLSTAAT